MDYQKIIVELKESSGLTWSELAERLGYTKGQKVMDIGRGVEAMSGPAKMCLAYYVLCQDNPKLISKAINLFKSN